MPCKLVLYFNQLSAGWSETYYHPSNDPVTLSQSIANSFYQLAVKFRSSDTLLVAARYSSTTPPRQSFLVRPYPNAQGSAGAGTDNGPDVVSTDAVYALQSTAGVTRRVFLRGLADEDVKRDLFGNDIQSAALRAGSNKFFQALNVAGFSIRGSNRPPNAGLSWAPIFTVGPASNAPDQYSIIRFAAGGPVIAVGDVLQFNGIPSGLPRWPRKAQVLFTEVVGAVTYYAVSYAVPGGVVVIPAKMKATQSTYTLSVISLWSFERFSEHKTGRPFGSLRGRARVA